MTMVPAQNLFKHKYGSYGGCEDSYTGGYDYYREACLGSDPVPVPVPVLVNGYMAEDESRSSSVNNDGSSSKKDHLFEKDKDESWLQLGLGGDYVTDDGSEFKVERAEPAMARRSELVELDLLPTPHLRSLAPSYNNNNNYNHHVSISGNSNISIPLLLQQPRTSFSFPHHHHQQQQQQQMEVSWGYSTQSSWNAFTSSTLMVSPWNMCYSQPLIHQYPVHGVDVGAGPSSDMRVIDAPSRQNSGVWFVLQASSNQVKEPFLPQIPKSYLRIKDGRMTVGLVMKYLVNKLKLNSESEIEITCRGLQLLPFFTLMHVRDTIWNSSRDHEVTLLSQSNTTDHLMILCYSRSA